jgi:serine/threonine-protein kinase
MGRSNCANGPDNHAISLQLNRILASREFSGAERMRRFLQLVVTETLAGRAGALKEYVIGLSVFDRPPSFDPGSDPIVRVEARRLRAKLENYYQGEGRGDSVLIELPKGRYSACFRARDAASSGDRPGATVIAVLPFQNVGGSEEGRYFSDGLTWELTHRLTAVEGLSVMAWNSAVQAGSGADPIAAAARLKAAAVLTGSVRTAGGRIRIVAQLIDASSGLYLWSEVYDAALQDVLAVQDDIACSIASRLQVKLGRQLPSRPVSTGYSPEAYQLYLEGRAHWNRRTSESLRRSLECFERAAEIDPNFARAWAGIADAYALYGDYAVQRPSEAMPLAKRAALRALEIDSSLAEAHCSLGLILALSEWKWSEAEAHFRRALDLNPGYATAHHWIAVDLLTTLGRFEEAREELDIAHRLDPLSLIITEGIGFVLMLQGRLEESVEVHQSIIRADPGFYKGHTGLGRVLIQMGRFDEAIDALKTGAELAGIVPNILGAMGQAYALQGNEDQARNMLSELERLRASSQYVPATCFTLIYTGLGEFDRAVEWLRRGAEERHLSVPAAAVHPAYDRLRDLPRFRELMQAMELRDPAANRARAHGS